MLPRWHIVLGAVFSGFIYYFNPGISWIYLLLVFLSSFLIDFDHYVTAVYHSGKFSLFDSFSYYKKMGITEENEHKKGLRNKGDFHVFHTLEFHLLIGFLSLVWEGFFYIFLGMVFHSLIDLCSMLYQGRLYRREFFFFHWLYKKLF